MNSFKYLAVSGLLSVGPAVASSASVGTPPTTRAGLAAFRQGIPATRSVLGI